MVYVTNKMQRNTIFFIAVKALHVSGGFSAHQGFNNCTCSVWYLLSLVAVTASVVEMEHLNHASSSSFDNNKQYRITLHLVGHN
jgi:hypothetical protein